VSGVLYEVTLRVRPAIAGEFRTWLQAHVGAMLALPGFLDARVSELLPADPDLVVLCCHYRLRDAAALDDYLREHAPRMRAQGLERFGTRFTAQRRVMTVLADY
jgi:quinol monooxygenase YgiN